MSSTSHAQTVEVAAFGRSGGRPCLACVRLARTLLGRQEGQSLVEMGVTLPVLLTFLIGFTQICLAFYTYDAISEMAREGTRYAMVRGTTCVASGGSSCTTTAAAVNTYVKATGLLNGGNAALTVATTYPDGNEAPGSRVTVSVSYVFGFTLPFTTFKPFTMSTRSTAYIIQ